MAYTNCSSTPLAVSDHPSFTEYMGTREQLLSAGVAQESHFPEGRKRTKQGLGKDAQGGQEWETYRLKGGRFRFLRYHEWREPRKQPPAAQEFKNHVISMAEMYLLVINKCARGGAYYDGGVCLDDTSLDAIACASARLMDAVRACRVAGSRKETRLTLVKG